MPNKIYVAFDRVTKQMIGNPENTRDCGIAWWERARSIKGPNVVLYEYFQLPDDAPDPPNNGNNLVFRVGPYASYYCRRRAERAARGTYFHGLPITVYGRIGDAIKPD
jgi:hypothetical protein